MTCCHYLYMFLITLVNLYELGGMTLGDMFKRSKECDILTQNFSNSSANFMHCILQYARPVHICCSCAEAYNSVKQDFDNIIKAKNAKYSTCDKLVNQDRLEVIETTITFFNNLWYNGHCNDCFEDKNKSIVLAETTKEFNKLNYDTNQCLNKFYNSSSKTYDKNACQNCSDAYFKQNQFYLHLKETTGIGYMCIDIVDSMNITRRLWQKVLHCGTQVWTFEVPLIVISVFILMLPIIYYTLASKFAMRQSSLVLHRNRLSQRFGERWRNRAGSSISN